MIVQKAPTNQLCRNQCCLASIRDGECDCFFDMKESKPPSEETNQDELWVEVQDVIDSTIESGHEGSIEGRSDIIPILKTKYSIQRKQTP